MNVSNVAYSTVNTIVKEVFTSYKRGVDFTKKIIEMKLREAGLDEGKISNLLDLVGKDDPFEKARERLQTERKRISFIKESFHFVDSETVLLSPKDSISKDTYQYVPIHASLKVLLEDSTFIRQKFSDPYHYDPNMIQDVGDGECFRMNPFFVAHPEAVPLILFQDELEVCNPLGSGKTRHKFNATYFTTLEIQPAYRSKVQSVQMVSLVPSRIWKKYGNAKCNQRLIDDLKVLETRGVEVDKPTKKIVRAGLQFIVGDNLGQHTLGEMNQVFSSGFICRWCKVTYREVCKEGLCFSKCKEDFEPEEWTVPDYNLKASKAEEDGVSIETCGIKGHCVFNQLEAFHSILQLPPCLGHDFYEGCMAYDLQFYLDYIINKEKLMSQEEFNRRLKNVMLSSRDSKNRPREFKTRKKNTKYEGNAGSLRVLGRVMTMLLSDVLDDSEVGQLIVKLQEVSELITAPKLTLYEIDNILNSTIMEYLEMRVQAIDDLGMHTVRPKHHYLSHYANLYKFQGPLIHLWAMRLESKHQYFKNCVRTSKNFINPTKTCASRHQMAQITFGYNGLFPVKLEIPDKSVSARELENVELDQFLKTFISSQNPDAIIPSSVTVFGTLYGAGMVLVLEKEDFGKLKIGVLKAISVVKDKVLFGCSTFESFQSKHCYYVTAGRSKILK